MISTRDVFHPGRQEPTSGAECRTYRLLVGALVVDQAVETSTPAAHALGVADTLVALLPPPVFFFFFFLGSANALSDARASQAAQLTLLPHSQQLLDTRG